jgi:hypothetical protein
MEVPIMRYHDLLAAVLVNVTLVCGSHAATGAVSQTEAVLDANETADLVYQREAEKLARDIYTASYGLWNEGAFYNTYQAELRHMDTMLKMLIKFGIPDPVVSNGEGEFSDQGLAALYPDLIDRSDDSMLAAFEAGAYIEELEIQSLEAALDRTDEPGLTNAYSNLLAASRNHLRTFVSHIAALGESYEAQVLDQSEVSEITDGYDEVTPGVGFTINNGINDAWFYPATPGQGFFITVYTDLQTIFLGWFTYDTERPAQDVTANFGDPGHRWLTAYGTYAGAQAELDIEITTGGIFDSEEPATEQAPGGSILLQFENCTSGSVIYDIPSIGRQGIVPIVRLGSDGVANCQQAP